MMRHHHERFDGTGYPDRRVGKDIPLAARILTIADIYDALTTTRRYRASYPHEEALDHHAYRERSDRRPRPIPDLRS